MTTYHAITLFIQGGKVFDAATRQIELSSLRPKPEEVARHLEGILSDNCNAQWGRDFEVPSRLGFGELDAAEIANRLADPLSNLPVSGISYRVLTRFTEYGFAGQQDGTLQQEEMELLSEFGAWLEHRDNQTVR